MQLSGAAMFNLSLLTSDMWAVVIRIFIYQQQVFPLLLCHELLNRINQFQSVRIHGLVVGRKKVLA